MRASGSPADAQPLGSPGRPGPERQGPVRARSKQRRAEIMSAAAALFAQRGFHGVSIDDIGSAAGLSGPGIYRHFPSKEAVLSQMLLDISERLLEEGGRRASAAADAQEALDALLRWHIGFALGQPDLITVQTRELANVPAHRPAADPPPAAAVRGGVGHGAERAVAARGPGRPADRRARDVRPAELHPAQRERAAPPRPRPSSCAPWPAPPSPRPPADPRARQGRSARAVSRGCKRVRRQPELATDCDY